MQSFWSPEPDIPGSPCVGCMCLPAVTKTQLPWAYFWVRLVMWGPLWGCTAPGRGQRPDGVRQELSK